MEVVNTLRVHIIYWKYTKKMPTNGQSDIEITTTKNFSFTPSFGNIYRRSFIYTKNYYTQMFRYC